MKIPITFANLTHTPQGISNSSFPLGASMVASYAQRKLEDQVKIDIFQYPEDLTNYLKKTTPKIACFSNFSWTLDIAHEFAKKIKEKSSETVIIFGGPNYPLEFSEQEKFLKNYLGIDFYIKNEGEKGFVELFRSLENFGFDYKEFKKNETKTGNCHYLYHGKIIRGENLSRLENLDEIPSPYLSGLLDKFFDEKLTPVIQTKRGCPFKCVYCQEGQSYFEAVTRFSQERTKEELGYIAKRVKTPNLIITDSNFGMYNEDLETCRNIAELKKKNGWPKYIEGNLGKNKKVVLEAVSLLNGDICLSAPVQSTNEIVLNNINRKNISMKRTIEIAKGVKSFNANSFSEIILCLPGDTKEAHFKSVLDMVDVGINVVRSHQLLMLPGSEISTERMRKQYNMKTKFRIQPKCFGNYNVYDKKISACEIDEICIENSTMPYKDYLDCRAFDLTTEIFYNNGIFQEPLKFLQQNNLPASYFIKYVNKCISQGQLREIYTGFLKETENSLWDNKKDLESFIKQPGMIEKYVKEDLRINEQLGYRALAFFYKMDELHKVAFNSAKELLRETGNFNEKKDNYLSELEKFSLLRKGNLLSLNEVNTEKFNYDFIALAENRFEGDPLSYSTPKDIIINFAHSDEQKELISRYIKQGGLSLNSLGNMLTKSNANKFYRQILRN